MPSKYVLRNFSENAYYHVFNRGVEGRDTFLTPKDYRFFTTYLFVYTRPTEEVLKKYPELPFRLQIKNLSEEVKILGYCLMPNHFHLLLKQITVDGISRLMKQLMNAYTLYFNEEHKRTGPLMQGRFKAVEIEEQNLLTHILRYIHLNPVVSGIIKEPKDLINYPWSSYPDYLGQKNHLTCYKDDILPQFRNIEKFENFHLDQVGYSKDLARIKNLTMEPRKDS